MKTDLKLKEVAKLLQVSDKTIYRWISDGKIPYYRLNHQYRFKLIEINKLFDNGGISELDKNETTVDHNSINIIEKSDLLYDENISIDEKKEILIQLAGVDDPKAFRVIEKFKEDQRGKELFEWTAMAYQESRTFIQGSLLEENQVFISTGMGGKGQKLRYFIVIISESDENFTETQVKLIKSEIEYFFLNSDSEIEEFKSLGKFVTITALIPISSNIKNLFSLAIDECNQLGNLINENFIVTNVKKLTFDEIEEFINNSDDEKNEQNINIE